MKIIPLLLSVWLCSASFPVTAQIVNDPLLDYYQAIKSGYSLGDAEPHYTSKTQVYSFQADFTGGGRKSIFITDDESRQGSHGIYGWSVYCPLSSGGYQKLEDGLATGKHGPPYIGYVAEIKVYGAVDSGRNVVNVQYVSGKSIEITFLGKNRVAEKEDYPQYFASPAKWEIQKTTLGELAQKYGK